MAAPPEGGKANEAVRTLLAGTLGLPRRDVELVAGLTSRDKLVTLVGLPPESVEERMAAAAGGQR